MVKFDDAREDLSVSGQARPKRILGMATKRLGLSTRAELCRLRREVNGSVIPTNKRLIDVGVSDGEVLTIEPVKR